MEDKTVLVIDADNASRNFIVRLLYQQQYKVLQTGSGKEGLIYAWRDRPSLILFDPNLPDIKAEEFLQKLRKDERTSETPILALSSDPSPARRKACLEAGCNEYILKSGEAAAMLQDVIARLMGTKALVVKDGGFLVVFLSAKGGTGTSSLCANFAMTISETEPDAKVVVLDLVLPIGSIAPIVGYQGNVNLVSVANLSPEETDLEYFRKRLPELSLWQFQLLPGARNPASANELQVARIPEIIDGLKEAYDYVVVDLGRSLSRISLPIIQKADLLVLIVSTDLSTITLTKTVWEYLQEQGIDAQNVYTILNRAVGLEGLTKAEAENIVGLPIKTTMPYLESNFALANNQNQPILLKYPTDTATLILKETAKNMISMVKKSRDRQK